MKVQEYRKKIDELTDDELNVMHKNSIDELFHLRFQLATAHLEDTSKVRQLKKNIARIKTILCERQLGTFWTKRGLKAPGKATASPKPVAKQPAAAKRSKGAKA